ncbi:MAG TPA: glycosyltransferase [Syntrophomonadaceae bacterium]|nr:glycosyltransferase [Syntrophomonadaceae bacterium]
MIIMLLNILQWFFLTYMLLLGIFYLSLNIISIFTIMQHMKNHQLGQFMESFSVFQPPISLLVPAYNESLTVASNVQSLLQLLYSEYEIIVINDGSKDDTLQILIDTFQLKEIPVAYQIRLESQKVKKFYQSDIYHNLRVIDKENGGKADALNVGINASRYPLFCSVDADSVLQRDSLKRIVQPFMEDPYTVAAGGTIRIVNGSQVQDGFLIQAGLPKKMLARMQIIEYLRAFLFGRLGWTPMNALLVISGAFGVFHKQTVIDVGGYRTDTVGEDMELVVRLHRVLSKKGKKYRITFVPDPICWTEVPEDLKSLKSQRTRWQRGLIESLLGNRSLCFSRSGGAVGWLAFPFMVLFEMVGPIIEVTGYLFVIIGYILGIISLEIFILFFLLAVGLGMLISVTSLMLEELSFHIYSKPGHVLRLFGVAIIENLGYRQLVTLWRLEGIWKWLRGGEMQWGNIERKAEWQK